MLSTDITKASSQAQQIKYVEEGIDAHLFLESDVIEAQHYPKRIEYAAEYKKNGYVKFPRLINQAFIERMVSDLTAVRLASDAKHFTMPGYDTPRKLSVLGGERILSLVPNLGVLYFHHEIRDFVREVRQQDLHTVRHSKEFLVANMLQNKGDTHGWHLDDPEMALVIFLKAPEANEGGQLEYIPDWDELCRQHGMSADDKTDRTISDLNAWNMVRRESHEAGDAYLLKASTILHRVTPITSDWSERWVVNMAFDTKRIVKFGNTADLLYS